MGEKDISEGDMALPGTAGAGEDICRACDGSGELDGGPCPKCDGTGKVADGIGAG